MKRIINQSKNFYEFLKKDTWQSWLVSLILIIIIIKFIFFPTLSLITGTPLPLVVVESCSMYHDSRFDSWWNSNGLWYSTNNINKSSFEAYPFKSGLNKGDIVFVWGRTPYKTGDIIIFNANVQRPLIHRLISDSPFSTKGDNNLGQLPIELNIPESAFLGKAKFKIPLIGWLKLIFFEPLRPESQRGFC
jgi:signal peptidase I